MAMAMAAMVIYGMSLGYADMSAPANRFNTRRKSVSDIATFHADASTSNTEAH